MRWFGIFCHFCCLLLLHTVPWLGCWGDTAAAPPLSQPLPSCWGVYPLSTKKSHSMTTDKHVPVHLPQMFIGTHKKTFCFCILKIVTFTSSKVQKCNFNQNPFKNSIKKIHQKSALFLIEMYYKSNTLWEGGTYLVLSRDVMPGLLFYILGLRLCSPTKQAVPVKERNIWSEKRLHFYNVLYIHVHLRKTLFWSIMKALLWYLCICAKTIVPFLPLASPQAIQKICLKFNKKISDTWSINIWFTIHQFDSILFF